MADAPVPVPETTRVQVEASSTRVNSLIPITRKRHWGRWCVFPVRARSLPLHTTSAPFTNRAPVAFPTPTGLVRAVPKLRRPTRRHRASLARQTASAIWRHSVTKHRSKSATESGAITIATESRTPTKSESTAWSLSCGRTVPRSRRPSPQTVVSTSSPR